MRCLSKKRVFHNAGWLKGFSLVEAVTALIILALFSSSVLVVVSRSMASAADSALRMQAFEVARENMETLLAKDTVEETTEYGDSDRYPEIQWETTVGTFYEPVTTRMWAQAVCAAEYTDSEGEKQKIELTHWLTDLTAEEMLKIVEQKQKLKEKLAEEGRTEEKPPSEEDLKKETAEDKQKQEEKQQDEDKQDQNKQQEQDEGKEKQPQTQKPERTYCGYTEADLLQLYRTNPTEFWKIMWNCEDF
jgi:type II secretory pathway pseudopilin PulG